MLLYSRILLERCLRNRVFAIRVRESGMVAQMPQCTFPDPSAQPDRSGAADVRAFRLADPQSCKLSLRRDSKLEIRRPDTVPRVRSVSSAAGSQVNTPF